MYVFPVSLQQVSPSARPNLWTRRTQKRVRRSSAAGASGERYTFISDHTVFHTLLYLQCTNSQLLCNEILTSCHLLEVFRQLVVWHAMMPFFSLFQSEIDKVEIQVSSSVCSQLNSPPVLHVCLLLSYWCHFTSVYMCSLCWRVSVYLLRRFDACCVCCVWN